MIEVMQLPYSLCIHIKGMRQMLYCNPIFNQYIISKTDCRKKKKSAVSIVDIYDACFLSKRERRKINLWAIYIFIHFPTFLFLSDVTDIIRRQAPSQMETNVGSPSALSEGPAPIWDSSV